MIREYPPMLSGTAEAQAAQLRAYLVRLIRYIDEMFREVSQPAATDKAVVSALDSQQDAKIRYLNEQVSRMPLIEHGAVSSTSDIEFARNFDEAPAVFATAGTISNVTTGGFTLTTNSSAQWIAVGGPARR